MKNIKAFIVLALSVLVVGFAFLGIFGFNQSIDYSDGYELQISIDQKADGATEILKNSVESYFEEKGLTPIFAEQVVNKGLGLIYKFDSDVTEAVADLNAFVKAELAKEEILSVDVVSSVSFVPAVQTFDDWKILVGVGIAVLAIFIYALIMDKLAGALATICSSLLSSVAFVALVALTRIPAAPFIILGCLISAVVGASLAVSTIGRYKEEAKNTANEKLSSVELVNKLFSVEKKKYLWVFVALVLIAVAFVLTMICQFVFLGVQMLLVAIASTTMAYFITPMIWSALKKNNK